MPKKRPLEERLMETVVYNLEGCWLRTGPVDPRGFKPINPGDGRNAQYSHRIAWELWIGEIPSGHHVIQRCGNKRCINPEHLRASLGTRRPIEDRLRESVEINKNGCWIFQGLLSGSGYGLIGKDTGAYERGKNGNQIASRVAWEVWRGEISDGLFVLHKCDTPACINPDHLFLGTQQDNVDDMVRKGRHCYGESVRGSLLTENDVREIRLLYAARKESQSSMARRFGVSSGAIQAVVSRRTWRHVA